MLLRPLRQPGTDPIGRCVDGDGGEAVPDWSREEFLTVAEVAAGLKLNQQTIRNWIDAHQLPAVRIGRRVRVLRSDLERLIESSSTAGAASKESAPEPTAENFWEPSAPPTEPEPSKGGP
jgi:excisionase family DNA binding protein